MYVKIHTLTKQNYFKLQITKHIKQFCQRQKNLKLLSILKTGQELHNDIEMALIDSSLKFSHLKWRLTSASMENYS